MPPPQRSFVWCFFVKSADNKFAVCQLCNQKLKYFTSTGNLRTHIIRKHPTEYNQEIAQNNTIINYVDVAKIDYPVKLEVDVPDSMNKFEIIYEEPNHSQTNVSEPSASKKLHIVDIAHQKKQVNFKTQPCAVATSNKTQLERPSDLFDGSLNQLTDAQQKQCDLALVKMIVKNLQLPIIVENSGFVEYSRTLNSLYKIPTQQVLTESLLKNLYLEEFSKLKSLLKEVKYISLSISIWQSNSNVSYISSTAHFIHKNVFHSRILSTNELISRGHTEKSLAINLHNVLKEYDIDVHQVVAIVSDVGVNTKKAVSEHLQKPHYSCVIHTLNLIARELLYENDQLKNITLKCNNLIRYFKHSVLAISNLGTPFIIKQIEDEKWTTILSLFEKLLEIKNDLTVALSKLPLAPESINSSEWKIVSDCVPILKPLELMTTELLSEKYITMSSVIPLLRGLQFELKNTNPVSETGSWLKDNILENVSKRLGNMEINKIVSKSTFLDPRYKKAAFGLEENARNCQNCLIDELEAMSTHSQIDANSGEEPKLQNDDEGNVSLWDHFDNKLKDLQTIETPTTSSALSLRQFLELPYCDRKSDPIEFWSKHQLMMPEVYDLYKKYASVPAICVFTKRIFSKMDVLSNCVSSSNNIDIILFLNSCFL